MKKHSFIALIIFLLGISLSVITFFTLQKDELAQLNKEFFSLTYSYHSTIEHNLQDSTHILNALAAYHYGSENIEKDEFQTFSNVILKHHTAIQSVAWIPELALHTSSAKMQPKNFFYPNNKVFKYNNNALQIFEKTITQAKKSGKIIVSPPIVQKNSSENLLFAFYPIYKTANTTKECVGCYVVTIKINELVQSAITRVSKGCKGINITISDKAANQGLFSFQCKTESLEHPSIHTRFQIKLYNRTWIINSVATDLFTDRYFRDKPWFVLWLMILFFGIISLTYFLVLRRQITLMESNEELRRFQNVAVSREERIMELKQQLSKCEHAGNSK